MEIVAYAVSAFLLVTWIWVAVQLVFAMMRCKTRQRHLARVAIAVAGVGIFSFLAPSCGSLIPSTIEWPVGLAGTVQFASNGDRVVAHSDSGRVQIYDAHWRFKRAIPVDVREGAMHMRLVTNDAIEVYSYRAKRRTVYALDGTQLASDGGPANPSYGPNHITFGPWVPTWPWLFSLSSPFVGWCLILLAMGIGIASGTVKINPPRLQKRS